MNVLQFLTNRAQFPAEELARYAGQYIAWSPDGSVLLASDDDPEKVIDALKGLGFDPGNTVISYVPPNDETLLAEQARRGTET
jgi:hypothetical protein